MRHFKKIIFKGRGFRGGSDEKIRRMWLGLEIDVVGLPPLAEGPGVARGFFFSLKHPPGTPECPQKMSTHSVQPSGRLLVTCIYI